MAYVFSNVQKGFVGPLALQYGNYSVTSSDTATISIPGGAPIILLFTDAQNNVITTQTMSARALSGPVTTYTLTSTGTIANGSFLWCYLGT